MDTAQILADLRAQRGRIDNAIAALEALNGTKPLGNRHDLPLGDRNIQKVSSNAQRYRVHLWNLHIITRRLLIRPARSCKVLTGNRRMIWQGGSKCVSSVCYC